MENTIENKAKFFALYLGQKVMRCKTFNVTTGNGLSGLMNVDVNSETIKENWFLELKPLSSISDEDLIKCYHLHSAFIAYDYTMDFKPVLEMVTHWRTNGGIKDIIRRPDTVDYLRSRGYALPFMGLSVEELVNRSWVKLKGENK